MLRPLKQSSRDQHFLEELGQIVLDNLTNEQFSVEQLADTHGTSRSYLHKQLKKLEQKSVSQFIREIRLKEAMKMLQQDLATASEIAYRVGFRSPTYFNTCFKDYFGYPPGEVKFRLPAEEKEISDLRDSEYTISPEVRDGRTAVGKKGSGKRIYSMLALGAAPGIAIILFIVFRTEDQSMQNLSAAPSIVTSIAVLPFEDVSSEKDQEAFTNAMVIEISDQLVKIDDLQVLSRASTQMYTRSKKSTREIASELESANILMGSVQKEGDNVRITVQLVDGGTDAFLWSEAYDGKLEGIFDMQRTIAHSVAEALKVQIRLLKFGLYKDRCSVGALLNVGKEQIGIEGIDTLEEMAALKQRVINAAREAVILNADDALCAGMIGQYRKLSVILFSMDPHNKILHDHLQNGGTAYVLNREKEEDGIERWEPQSREPFISISELPPAGNGMFPQNIANAMAAAALAEGMGIPLETIKEGLHSFRNSLEQSGGRLHFIEGYSQTILLDFLATVPASIALATSLGRIEVPGRRICMCTTPGDRQHWHYTEIGEALGPHFDHFICFDLEHYRRGRTPARSLNC